MKNERSQHNWSVLSRSSGGSSSGRWQHLQLHPSFVIPLCSLVCCSFFIFPFTEYRRKKMFPLTKHITSPSSQWHTLHPAVFFTLTFSPLPKHHLFQPSIPADKQGASLHQGGHKISVCLLLEGFSLCFTSAASLATTVCKITLRERQLL